jgi:hypothetical protein
MMQRDGELNHAKPRTKVTTGLAYAIEQKAAQFATQRFKLFHTQAVDRERSIESIEQGRHRPVLWYLCKHGRSLAEVRGVRHLQMREFYPTCK